MYMMCSGSLESPEGGSWEDDSLLFGSVYALQDIQPLRPCPLKVCSNPPSNYFDNQKHTHKFPKHHLWGSSRPLENHCTRSSYMFNEVLGDGELGECCRKQNKKGVKTTYKASVGHVNLWPRSPHSDRVATVQFEYPAREGVCSVTIHPSHASLFAPYGEPLLILDLLAFH